MAELLMNHQEDLILSVNDVCGLSVPNIALVVSACINIFTFLKLSRVHGVTGGSSILCGILFGGKVGELVA